MRPAAGAVVAGCLLAGCASAPPPPQGTFVEGRVQVRARLLGDHAGEPDGAAALQVRLAPPDGFHVYALDLPEDGVDGLGRPTRVGVVSGAVATGPATADRTPVVFRPAGLDVDLPVFPDGPVVVTVPVRRTSQRPPAVRIGYAACGPTTCLPPVERTLQLT